MGALDEMQRTLQELKEKGNYRTLSETTFKGRYATNETGEMLNLSSNDYLGLAHDPELHTAFLRTHLAENMLLSSSSSRLLTGNHEAFVQLEKQLARQFGTEAALVFNSGYHANSGLLPAVADAHTMILADKLVHASLIDGIRLSAARAIRYRHNDYEQLERLLAEHAGKYKQVIIVTESLFSMDGDMADLHRLTTLKQSYNNVLLYVDEAHAYGVRGERGLGCAEEADCIQDIDFLVGTFGKAAASMGAYWVGKETIRDYLVNRMRTFIFSTALPPLCAEWTTFVNEALPRYNQRRNHLATIAHVLKNGLTEKGYPCPSESHIVPIMVGDSIQASLLAESIRRKGFYVLPVRPPTVPEGTARIRVSLTAEITEQEIANLLDAIPPQSTPANAYTR